MLAQIEGELNAPNAPDRAPAVSSSAPQQQPQRQPAATDFSSD
jgi:hypothetical protein